MRFKVHWKKGNDEGIESEASWFLVDQQGHFYVHGPLSPIRRVLKEEYDELTPLIQIDDKWLSIKELKAENAMLREESELNEEYVRNTHSKLVGLNRENVLLGEDNAKLRERVERYKEAVSSVLECGECNLYHGYICPMCARGLQALKEGSDGII